MLGRGRWAARGASSCSASTYPSSFYSPLTFTTISFSLLSHPQLFIYLRLLMPVFMSHNPPYSISNTQSCRAIRLPDQPKHTPMLIPQRSLSPRARNEFLLHPRPYFHHHPNLLAIFAQNSTAAILLAISVGFTIKPYFVIFFNPIFLLRAALLHALPVCL